jgi:predicted GH43/DUF377 family glycosyl hydrolase
MVAKNYWLNSILLGLLSTLLSACNGMDAVKPSDFLKAPVLPESSERPTFEFVKTNKIMIDRGNAGEFDSCQAKYPSVLIIGTEFYMWYNGRQSDCDRGAIGLARSRDGITWEKHGQPILPYGPSISSFATSRTDHPAVLVENGQFRMWFTMTDSYSRHRIGYATSLDGISWHLENSGRPVLGVGNQAEFDGAQVLHPTVVKDENGTLHMYYNGTNVNTEFRLGHAISRDGINWQRENNGRPVLVPSFLDGITEKYVYNAFVMIRGGQFHMWYSALVKGTQGGISRRFCITHASSQDGNIWVKDKVPTVCNGAPGDVDGYAAYAPYVVETPEGLRMYYSATDQFKVHRTVLAVQSKDLNTLERF